MNLLQILRVAGHTVTDDELSSNRQSVIALKTLPESIIQLVRRFEIKLLIAADSVFTKSV